MVVTRVLYENQLKYRTIKDNVSATSEKYESTYSVLSADKHV